MVVSGSIEIYTGDATNGEGGDILLSLVKVKPILVVIFVCCW